jgi:uncharacterized membrane protein YphA (DoxX/SURF4 family)
LNAFNNPERRVGKRDAKERTMKAHWIRSRQIARLSIALVWFYQGLWCKVLGRMPHHLSIISSVPFIGPGAGRAVLVLLGAVECGLGAWVLTGWRPRIAAIAQAMLLVAMNAGGMIWAWRLLPDPAGMILQNFAFVILIWTATEVRPHVASE